MFYALPLQTCSGVYILKKCILVISRDDFIHMLEIYLIFSLDTEDHNIFQLLFLSYRRYPIAVFVFTGIFLHSYCET